MQLEKIIKIVTSKLHEFNSLIIIGFCKYLGIDTKIIYKNSDFIETTLSVKSIARNLEGKTIRVLEICQHKKYFSFVNAIGGQELSDKETFNNHNIKFH